MAIATLDDLIEALGTNPYRFPFQKTFTPGTAGMFLSLFNIAGIPGAAATPSSGINGDIPTDATAGALPFTNPVAPIETYLGQLTASGGQGGTLHVFDRLWHNNFPNATTTTAQAISPSALTRYTTGVGVEPWFQVYVATGAGAPSPTIVYTDQDGNTGQAGAVVGYTATSQVGRTYPISLAAGDTGVRAITSYTSSISMSSGTIGLVLRKRLASLPITLPNTAWAIDALTGGLPQIEDNACIELVWQAFNTSAMATYGTLDLIQG